MTPLRIPLGLAFRCQWSGGMIGALKMMKKVVRKANRIGPVAKKSAAIAAAEEIAAAWDDGSWFESWASAQPPGKEEMMNWAMESLLPGEEATDYECCRAAFCLCVSLELLNWEIALPKKPVKSFRRRELPDVVDIPPSSESENFDEWWEAQKHELRHERLIVEKEQNQRSTLNKKPWKFYK